MFGLLERVLKPTEPPAQPEPPPGLTAFYWHFARQAKGLLAALFVAGFVVALLDSTIPVFVGRIVSLLTANAPERLFADYWHLLLAMALVLLVARPIALTAQNLIANQAIAANVGNLIRWQSHWHVVRQSWAFFQNDFAGRIASKVMQTGPAVRESLVALLTAVWYILVYGTSAALLLAAADKWLALPVLLWFVGYVLILRAFVPHMRDRSHDMSEARSVLTGRIVDAYTNILTVKLFARARDEDAYVRRAVDEHTGLFHASLRLNTLFGLSLSTLNALLVVSTGGLAILLWTRGVVAVGTVAMALPLAWQIVNVAGWVAWQVTAIFENIGVVQEGMSTIARPIALTDRADAAALTVTRGEVKFENVRFGYGRETGLIDGLSLTVRAGEKIGLVGRSGAGKSTLVNLLLRFFDLEDGRILIDGQDIAAVTQESLRGQISVVTQDTSLLHRSIRDNIRYGRPEASEAEIVTAAHLAHADEFIGDLEDWKGRRGFDAQVGERGVKLSGGQRQRIAIARVILKNAPILVLDEATSALDSEVEAAIQASLGTLMAGRTVIAIAHRLSTIAQMDRLVVLDRGRIVEQGSHDELLRRNGHYAALWRRQSGGFIDAGDAGEVQAAE
ncbi:MAG TPA: ABC transporter ATP-binding protein [Xanthobacteraceae bacterium]|jgi:ATP-binding cassette subfamily B multidrug efflux pump|nr:ABC transporter ATP-binding protein [Xanthobacteraceae bacterium]